MTAITITICLSAAMSVATPAPDAGRCVMAAESADARVAPKPQIAPGPPPMLSFRYYEGKLHHRYSNSDLMLDDAGH